MWPRNASSTSPAVSLPEGRWRDTMSQLESSSGSESAMSMRRSAARSSTSALRPGFARARTSIPNARARWATSSPMEPSPRMPIVDPSSPRASPYFFFSQRPARRSTVPSTIRRSTASSSPMVSSATAAAFLSGQVGDQDPTGRGCARVDRVRARAGADHQCQPVGHLEHVAAHLGAAHDQGVVPADAAGQVGCLELGLDDAGVAARLELRDGRSDDGVGEKDAHSNPPSPLPASP